MSAKRKGLHQAASTSQDETGSPASKRRKFSVSAPAMVISAVCSSAWVLLVVSDRAEWCGLRKLKLGAKKDAGLEGLGRIFAPASDLEQPNPTASS